MSTILGNPAGDTFFEEKVLDQADTTSENFLLFVVACDAVDATPETGLAPLEEVRLTGKARRIALTVRRRRS